MRTAILALLVLGLATTSWASSIDVKSSVPVTVNLPEQDLCWYQAPHYYLWTINASTPFFSELADDIPTDQYPVKLFGMIYYAAEWGGYFINPAGVYINFYDGCCPPAQDPYLAFYFAWDNPGMSRTQIYYSPGWFEAYEVTQMWDEPICLVDCTSIGWQLDLFWGQNPPYGGVCTTNDYDVYGCGQGYWDGSYFGVPRWSTISYYFGTQADIAYGIICTHEPSAAAPSTWGAVKSLYE